ncbi:hypothetical protein [Ensifer sp. 22460]|uniref:hypothetical protein n=1 Tax=Ensifer sp. 22460 TaxID=3453922 RepID=UPI003F853BD2
MDILNAQSLSSDARTSVARNYVDAAEGWLRKLIHYQLTPAFGATYLSAGGILKSPETLAIRKKVEGGHTKFSREVDATTFGQAKKIVCHPDRWDKHFSVALERAYPLGQLECAIFLDRLIAIRNDLQHGRGCSARQVEQAICYTNDLADAVKVFFREKNMVRDYDVPLIVGYSDSLGNQSTLEDVSLNMSNRNIDWRRHGSGDLYPGDVLTAEVKVDPTFDPTDYEVFWSLYGYDKKVGSTASIELKNENVGEQFELSFTVQTYRDWHRQNGVDDHLTLLFRVLPPLK